MYTKHFLENVIVEFNVRVAFWTGWNMLHQIDM